MQTGNKLAPNTSPEGCWKRAEELYKGEGKWEDALAALHFGLQNRRTKQNMDILEKLMKLMIDICTDKLTMQYLKEDIGHFRNLCQHQSTNLLEKVLTYLRNKSEKTFLELEKSYGKEKLMKIISDDPEEADENQINEQDATPEDLLLIAYTGLEHLEEKQSIQPKATFFLDICKSILDTLRSNSKLLVFYNETAQKMFDLCKKYKCKREYRRVSETLHSHFNQIIKNDKQPDLNSRIPHPIKLDEEDQLTLILKLRKEQLELALQVQEWTDAHRVSHSIFLLMNRAAKKKTDKEIKEIYKEFFGHLSSIFWESNLYLFHTYAQMNFQYLAKSIKQPYNEQRLINDKFVLSALSIPLHNRISQFERMPWYYVPSSMKEFDEANLMVREELLATSKMLQVQGYPSRKSMIHYINIENIKANTTEEISVLFNLIENEESPFVISKKGKASLDQLCKNPEFLKYQPFIQKTLSVRILQKCKSFYKTMKLSKLTNMLSFCGSVKEVEILLQECNREDLVHTVINYHSHGEGTLTFNVEAKVAENLFAFGSQLNSVFLQIVDATTETKQNRKRIFEKVKEKLEEEVQEQQKQKQEMQEQKEQARVQKEKIAEERKIQSIKDAERKLREQKEQAERDEQRINRNKIEGLLLDQKKLRAEQILKELKARDIKKIGKNKIETMLAEPEKMNYDEVIVFYEGVLAKEREQVEEDKKKKLREVELWTRAVREEEKLAIQKYAKEHGDDEIEQIKKSIQDKLAAENKQREALLSAKDVFLAHMNKMKAKRNQEWQDKKDKFMKNSMEELKEEILQHAQSEWRKDENKRIIEAKKIERAQRDLAIKQKEIAANKERGGDGDVDAADRDHDEIGWGKGTLRPSPTKGSPEKPRGERTGGASGFGEGFIKRSDKPRQSGPAEEEKSGRPTFNRGPKKDEDAPDTGFVRGNFKRNEAPPKKEGESGPPKFTRSEKPKETSGSGFGGFRNNAKTSKK